MNNNQNILEKLKNLVEPSSSILSELHNKKNKNEGIVAKSNDAIASKNAKITSIKNDIATLEDEKSLLTNAFASLKDTDLSLIISVLKLKVNVKEDLDKLTNQLPLQLTIRENDITDLESDIKKETENLTNANGTITELNEEIKEALENQKELKSLLIAATSGTVEKTREEVISILKKVNFNDKDAYKTAKLILFPEDELIPFFKNYKFITIDETPATKETSVSDKPEDNSIPADNNDIVNFDDDTSDTYIDLDKIVSLLSTEENTKEEKEEESPNIGEKNSSKSLETLATEVEPPVEMVNSEEKEEPQEELSTKETSDIKDENSTDSTEILGNSSSFDDLEAFTSQLEDETPISFEELKNLFEEDKEDAPTASNTTSIDLADHQEEEPKISLEEPINFSKETLISLGHSSSDIDLVKPFDTTSLDPKNILETLKNEDINPQDISLVIYQNGLANYLANLHTLKDNDYKPSLMELQKFGVSLSLIDNAKLTENLHILSNYKVSLKNTNGKIIFKVLCQEPNILRRNLDLIIEARETNLLNYNISALSQNVPLILERINFCKEYNIPYTEEKNNLLTYNSYVFSQKILEELVEKEVELTNLNKSLTTDLEAKISKEAYNILKENHEENPKLVSAKKFDDYSKIINKLETISVSKENAYIIDNLAFSTENTRRNLITLVNNLDEFDEKDIILAGLFYGSHKTLEDLAKLEKEL